MSKKIQDQQDAGEVAEHEESFLGLIAALQTLESDFKLNTRFNIFEAVAIERQEIRHSRFLAYLLDPGNPHGMGDSFLRGVLSAALAEHPERQVSRLDVAIADLDDCVVHCERDHFDISVDIPKLNLLFVIENKIDATESIDQLKSYKTLALKRYEGRKFLGTFLTLTGYAGEDESWGTMSYTDLVLELKRAVSGLAIPADVQFSIAHYISLIERKIVASQELIDACKRIYKQYRVAVDLLVQYGQQPQLAEAFEQFAQDKGLRATVVRSNTVYFLFDSWVEQVKEYPKADQKRWHSDFPVLLWLDVNGSKLYLRLEVGPLADGADRTKLVERLQEKFEKKAGKVAGGTYTRIVTCSTKIDPDPDMDELIEAMEKVWKLAGPQGFQEGVMAVMQGL